MNISNALFAGALATIMMGATATAPALADDISALPTEDSKTISYTPCDTSQEVAECIVYTLTCRDNEEFGSGLELSVVGQGNSEQPGAQTLARTFLDKPYGEQKLAFSVGGKTVEIPVNAVIVWGNELNGDWDLMLRSMDPGAFYDALTDATSGTVSAAVGSFTAQLADTKAEGETLMALKKACQQ